MMVLAGMGAGRHGHAPDSGGGRFDRLWPLVWLAWLPALAPSIAALFHAHPAPLRLGVVLAGVALFVAVYVWAAWHSAVSHAVYAAPTLRASWRWRWGPIVVLAALSVVLILGDGPRWLELFIYTSATVGARLPLRQAVWTVAVLILLAVALGWLAHDPWSDLGLAPVWVGMAGVFVIILNYLRLTNRALRIARAENARLAVEAERLRIARDLHDLLGHNLARIALQSEVVEALIPTAPERAIAAAGEIGDVARTALHEVRAAVAGYRQPTLASELRAAAEILAAAGIAYSHEGGTIAAPPAVEAVLAWAVREGVTNVVKHSRARRCTIHTTGDAGHVGVEVSDDGAGAASDAPASTPGPGGHGLAGLAERVAMLGGRCDAGAGAGGGFYLRVVLPVEQDARGEDARVEDAHAARPAVQIGMGETA